MKKPQPQPETPIPTPTPTSPKSLHSRVLSYEEAARLASALSSVYLYKTGGSYHHEMLEGLEELAKYGLGYAKPEAAA
jgi:hypothetical protein